MGKSEKVNELAAKISYAFSINKDGKCEVDKDVYTSNLPEGLTKETIESVNDYNSTFYPAATKAFGEVSINGMKANKGIEELKASIPLAGKNTLNLSIERETTYSGALTGKEPTTHYGTVRATVTTYSADASRGEMKRVRDELRDAAFASLKNL